MFFTLSTGQINSERSSQLVQPYCLKFDEFLAEKIHSQLVDFDKTRCFKFQSYLMKMFLSFNEENLQLPEMLLTKEMNRDYSKFMNFLMSEVYNAFFHKKFPRVIPHMKEMLQFSPEKRIGEQLLFELGIVIRLYGFVHQPHMLPAIFYCQSILFGTNQTEIHSGE